MQHTIRRTESRDCRHLVGFATFFDASTRVQGGMGAPAACVGDQIFSKFISEIGALGDQLEEA